MISSIICNKVLGFTLKRLKINKAYVIPEYEGTEVLVDN